MNDKYEMSSLPEDIRRLTEGKPFRAENIGMSDSGVYIFEDMVLKIENDTDNVRKTAEMMDWLGGRLSVPRVIEQAAYGEKYCTLMNKIKGKMSCDEYYLERPKELVRLLAEGLKMLWSVDISDCPRDRGLPVELAEARQRVEAGLTFEAGSPAEKEFGSPVALLRWLEDAYPEYDPVLSHGDYCLPNIFLDGDRISGFIDLGDCGTADRWRDIALCCRSLKHNTDGTYGKVYEGYNEDMLFDELGICPDREKLRYYTLLDELF